jgi:hypothetical protein
MENNKNNNYPIYLNNHNGKYVPFSYVLPYSHNVYSTPTMKQSSKYMEYKVNDFYLYSKSDLDNLYADKGTNRHNMHATSFQQKNSEKLLMQTYIGSIGIVGLFVLYRMLYASE